jgi:hypothetical protein
MPLYCGAVLPAAWQYSLLLLLLLLLTPGSCALLL